MVHRDKEEIASILIDFNSNKFTSSSPSGTEEAVSLVNGWVDEEMSNILDAPFMKEKVFDALSQMNQTKFPRVDGTPTLFY